MQFNGLSLVLIASVLHADCRHSDCFGQCNSMDWASCSIDPSAPFATKPSNTQIKTCHRHNIYAFQFHPEKSGTMGLNIYKNFNDLINDKKQ